jgi:hypothetical protein
MWHPNFTSLTSTIIKLATVINNSTYQSLTSLNTRLTEEHIWRTSCNIIMDATEENPKKRKADSTPPDGYVCRLCSVAGVST